MKPKHYFLLVVDDDPQHGEVIRDLLSQGEFFHPGLIAKRSDGSLAIAIVQEVNEALQLIRRGRPRYDVIIADLFMPAPEGGPPRPDCGAEKIYVALQKLPPDRRPLLIVTSNRDNDAQPKVREMLQVAARDKNRTWVEFVPKPESAAFRTSTGLYSDDNYAWALAHAISQQRDRDWKKGHLTISPEEFGSAGVRLNAKFTEAVIEAQRLSDQRLFIVEGEDGTGREQIAARIHSASSRKESPYVAKACSSLGVNSLKPQLLGWVRGYEGSAKTMPGFLQQCGRGTLFLDDFDFDENVTTELSRALHGVVRSSHFTPMGSIHEPLPFRGSLVLGLESVAALRTIGPTAELMQEIRVSGSVITLPSLRSCMEDIVPLAQYFLAEFSRSRSVKRLSPEVEEVFRNYTWPQNIREMSGLMSYCAHHVAAAVIRPIHIARRLRAAPLPASDAPASSTSSNAEVPELRSRGAGRPSTQDIKTRRRANRPMKPGRRRTPLEDSTARCNRAYAVIHEFEEAQRAFADKGQGALSVEMLSDYPLIRDAFRDRRDELLGVNSEFYRQKTVGDGIQDLITNPTQNRLVARFTISRIAIQRGAANLQRSVSDVLHHRLKVVRDDRLLGSLVGEVPTDSQSRDAAFERALDKITHWVHPFRPKRRRGEQ